MKAILTKYLAPTNTKGARVKAYDMDHNSVTVPYDYGHDYTSDAHKPAITAFIEKYKWGELWNADTLACGTTETGYAWVWHVRLVK